MEAEIEEQRKEREAEAKSIDELVRCLHSPTPPRPPGNDHDATTSYPHLSPPPVALTSRAHRSRSPLALTAQVRERDILNKSVTKMVSATGQVAHSSNPNPSPNPNPNPSPNSNPKRTLILTLN